MKHLLCTVLLSVLIFGCNNSKKEVNTVNTTNSQDSLSVAQRIAQANGIDNWKDVSEIKFTFNVGREERRSERSWIWKPKTNDVTMISGNDTLAYNRSKMDSIIKRTDAAFINDKYWLLAPYNLVWDEGTSFSEKNNVVAPISKDTLNILTILYGAEGGYTPGDAYDFYYDENYKIKEWIFRQANSEKATMMTTWEDYSNFEGLQIAKMHKDSTGLFQLYFTNIEVKK